jgi:hypothetical protein
LSLAKGSDSLEIKERELANDFSRQKLRNQFRGKVERSHRSDQEEFYQLFVILHTWQDSLSWKKPQEETVPMNDQDREIQRRLRVLRHAKKPAKVG